MKNKLKKYKDVIITIFLFLLSVLGTYFIYTYVSNNSDSKKFYNEYNKVDINNVFVYASIDEIIEILNSKTGIVYLGFKECPWCQQYVKYLNEVAKEKGVEKIYYYDIREDRTSNTKAYKKIVELIKDHLMKDEEGNERIYVPDVTVVKNGKIIGHDNETSVISTNETPEEYWTKTKIENLKARISLYIESMQSQNCTNGCND